MSKSRDIADSAATINYIDTVTSNVQSQIDNIDALPSQSGNAGKFLTTDGTTDSWGEVSASPTLEAVASGTLANGDTVIINADGTVSAAGLVTTDTPVIGSKVEFEAGTTSNISSCYDTGSNKVIIAYKDGTDGNKVKAIVGTVASGAITFGTPANLDGNQGNFTSIAYDANANKVVVVYHKTTTNDGVVQVGTVSGTSISFGSENVFSSTQISYNAIRYDSSANKLIIAWYSPNDTILKVTVGTISGTNMTFGAVVTTASPSSFPIGLVYDANANKTLLCYTGPNSYGYAAVISVSGTTASIGTPAPFVSESVLDVTAVYDSSNNKTLIVWRKASNSHSAAIVATISGTSVTFGTAAVLVSADTRYFGASFDTTVNKAIVAYRDYSSSSSKSVQGTISGTSVTFTSPVTYLTASTDYNALAYDPDSERTIFAFDDNGNSSKGTSLLYSSTTLATNLTTENYIGISDAAYSNGATATIQLVGTVDDAQTSLTAGQSYFVQDNGSIALTPATTPVFAGTAVSATKLLIGERNVFDYPSQTGNSGKFLTTNGTVASWGTPAGGAFTFISTTNLNGTSVVELRNLPVGTYDNFYILITGFGTSAADQNLYARMYSNDSLSTSGNYLAGARLQGGGSSLSYQSQYTSSWNVNKQGTGGYTGGKATLQLWLTNMNDTEPRNFNGYSQFYQGYGANPGNSSMNEQSTNLICGNSESGSFDGIRFYINSGTFVGGQAHVYGFKTS